MNEQLEASLAAIEQLSSPPPWPDEDIQFLKEQWEAGRPASEIAKKLGKSRSAIIGKANRLGLQARTWGKPWSEEDKEQLRKFWHAGASIKFISRTLGRSTAGVRDNVKRVGLKPRPMGNPLGENRNPVDVMKVKRLNAIAAARLTLVPAVSPDDPTDGVPLMEVNPFQCRWVVNTPAADELHLFCRHGSVPGSAYCGKHTRRAWARYAHG